MKLGDVAGKFKPSNLIYRKPQNWKESTTVGLTHNVGEGSILWPFLIALIFTGYFYVSNQLHKQLSESSANLDSYLELKVLASLKHFFKRSRN